jgi:DNA-binding protein HU-beta
VQVQVFQGSFEIFRTVTGCGSFRIVIRSSNLEGECMNKGELIEAVAGAAGLSRADATKAVDAVLDSVTSTLSGGGQVSLVGFGTFSVKARAARMGRNPRTGEPIQIKASNVPGFKAGKGLKDAVN